MQTVTLVELIEAAAPFLGGLIATLYGFRVLGKNPGLVLVYDARSAKTARLLRTIGPLLMIVSLFLLFAKPPPKTPPPPQWQSVTTPDAICRVEMPGEPSSEKAPLRIEGLGKPQAQQLRLDIEEGKTSYVLTCSDIPRESAELSSKELLDGILKNKLMLAQHLADAHLVEERDFSIQGSAGKQFVIDFEEEREQDKWIVVNKRLYRAIVTTPRDETHLRDAERFLNSFEMQKHTVSKD